MSDTTVVHLLRHGEVDNPRGIIYGRLPGYHLSANGRAMAEAAADYFAERPVVALYSSPLERAQETARPVAERDYFAPSNWKDLDNHDLDLGSTAPIPLDVPSASGVRKLILAIGKDGNAYLLDRDNLGGIGGELASAHVTPMRAIASPAVWSAGDGVFVALEVDGANCPPDSPGKGLLVLKISADPAPAISTGWCNKVVSFNGAPIVTTTDGRSNPIVFALGSYFDNRLYAYRGDTGELLAPPQPVPGTVKFQTLIAADGRLYVTAGGKVQAFTF